MKKRVLFLVFSLLLSLSVFGFIGCNKSGNDAFSPDEMLGDYRLQNAENHSSYIDNLPFTIELSYFTNNGKREYRLGYTHGYDNHYHGCILTATDTECVYTVSIVHCDSRESTQRTFEATLTFNRTEKTFVLSNLNETDGLTRTYKKKNA